MTSPTEFKNFVDDYRSSEDEMSSDESDHEDLGPLCRKLAQDNWDLKLDNKNLALKVKVVTNELEETKKMLEMYKAMIREKREITQNTARETARETSGASEDKAREAFIQEMKEEVGWDDDAKSVLY